MDPAKRAGSINSDSKAGNQTLSEANVTPQARRAVAMLGDDGITIASFWKSARNRDAAIQISLKQYQGTAYIDCRTYITNPLGRMVPTQKGVTIGMKQLPTFAKAIGDGYRRAVALGLLTEKSS